MTGDMGGNTRSIIERRLYGRIASLMLILSLLVGVEQVNGQVYQYETNCAGGSIPASVVLAGAVTGGGATIPVVDQTGCTWTDMASLTFSSNDESAMITKTVAGNNNYHLDWTVGGITYDVLLKTRPGFTAPTVIDFYAVDPTPCGIPYNAETILTISGGSGNYDIDIEDETSTNVYSNILASANNLLINLGSESTDKTYTITTVSDGGGCIADVTGVTSVSFTNVTPQVFTVTGGTACADVGVNVNLTGAEVGIRYDLYLDNVKIADQIGNGNFGLRTTPGVYTIKAFNIAEACEEDMLSSAEVVAMPEDKPIVNTGTFCPSAEIRIGSVVNPTLPTVSYTLYRGAGIVNTLPGNNGELTFGVQAIPGVYTVKASSGACISDMSGSVAIQAEPSIYTLSANKLLYCPSAALSDVNLTLADSDGGLLYQLQKWNAGTSSWDNDGGVRIGDGNPIVWSNVLLGSYRVQASNAGGCPIVMTGNPIIQEVPEPSATINAQLPNRRCANIAGNFTLVVTLSGNPPFDFDIIDDKGNTTVTELGYNLGTYSITVNPSDAETTYRVVNLRDAANCNFVNSANTATVYVDPLPVVTFSPAAPEVCLNSSIEIEAFGAGVGGTYSWSDGLGVAQKITVAPVADITYTVTARTSPTGTAYGCSASKDISVVVNPLPVVDFNPKVGPPYSYTYCEDDALVELEGSHAGGFTGDGIMGNNFDPSTANIGVNNVTFTYADPKGCINSVTKQFVVNRTPTVNITNLNGSYCADAGVITVNATPPSAPPATVGTFEVVGNLAGKGVWWDDNNNGTAWIDIAGALNASGEGNYELVYTYTDLNGCTASVSRTTFINANLGDDLNIDLPAIGCQTDVAFLITATFNSTGANVGGGTFTSSGAGLTDNGNGTAGFDPSTAGNGNHTVTFTYTDPVTGCVGTITRTMQVGTVIDLVPALSSSYCRGEAGFNLIGNQAPNGTMTIYDASNNVIASGHDDVSDPSGLVRFDPSVLAAGDYQIEYTYISGGCTNKRTWDVEVVALPDASFLYPDNGSGGEQNQFCVNNASVAMRPVNTAGTFTMRDAANAVVSGISGLTLDPAVASVGSYQVTYQVTQNGCTSTYTHPDNLSIVGLPSLAFSDLYDTYCDNDNTVPTTISINTTSVSGTGTFSSTKNAIASSFVTDNGDNSTADLNLSAGAGVYTVRFDYEDAATGCENTIRKDVEVFASIPVTFTGVIDGQTICRSSGDIDLRGEFPAGVITGLGNFVEFPGLTNSGTDTNGAAIANDDGKAVLSPSALAPGDYTIRYEFISDDNCVTSFEKDITIADAPTNIFDVTGGGAYCIDDAPKGVTIGLNGGIAGVTYELLLNDAPIGVGITNTPTITGPFNFESSPGNNLFVDQGIYTVRAKVATCDAMMQGNVVVEEYDLVLTLDIKTDVSCKNGDDATVTLAAAGGSGNYEFRNEDAAIPTWQASPTFNGLEERTYSFSVRDLSAAACAKSGTLYVTINAPTALVVTENVGLKINVGCTPCTAGVDCEGSATISISGGTPYTDPADLLTYPTGYGIIWSTGGNDLTETAMPIGNHSVTVTDANGCSETIAVDIIANPALTLAENVVLHKDNVCNTGADGEYVVVATGGTGVYQFSVVDPTIAAESDWRPANEGVDSYKLGGLTSGSYNIWVRDADPLYNRCVAQLAASIVITEPTALNISEEIASHKDITCNTATDGEFIVRATGGLSGTYNFSLIDPALGAVWEAANNGVDGFTVGGKGAGVYSVWVQDAVNITCDPVKVDVTILDVNALSYTLDEHTNVLCNSGNNGRLEVTAQGGSGTYVYQWEQPLGTIISTDKFIEDLTTGDYHLTIQDAADPTNICTPITETFTISQPTALTLTEVDNVTADCSLQNNGAIEIQVTGGTTDFSSHPGIGYDIVWSNGETNVERIENLAPGNYTVQIVDANGCTIDNIATPYTVGVLPDITLESSNLTHNDCFEQEDGQLFVKVDGGSGLYEFRLQGDKIEDWTKPVAVNSDEFTWRDLADGNYEVLVRDAAHPACEFSMGIFTITEGSKIELTYNSALDVQDVTCNGDDNGSISVNASGGSGVYDYSLDNGLTWPFVNQPGSYTFTTLSKGTYFVIVRDALGCSGSNMLTIDIEQPESVSFDLNPLVKHVSCYSEDDASITVSGQGGSGNYDYSIDGGIHWQTSGLFDRLSEGIYNLSIRDRADVSCEHINILSITITQPSDFAVSESHVDVDCFGTSTGSITISATGGEGTFEYQLSDAGSVVRAWQPLPTFQNLPAGTYDVSVRDMGTGAPGYCEKTNVLTIVVAQPASALTIDNVSITDVECYGDQTGAIDVDATGGTAPLSYQWRRASDNAIIIPTVSDDNPTVLFADDYILVVTDNNNCTVGSTITVAQPNAEIQVTHSSTDITVDGVTDGTITVNPATGGTAPYTITWSDGAAYDGLWYRDNLAAGDYTYTVTDDKGCFVNQLVTIIGDDALNFTLDKNTINCYGDNSGFIEVKVTGGAKPIDIEWDGTRYDGATVSGNDSDISTNYTISSLYAGTYTVKLIDANGELTKVTTIAQTDEVEITLDDIDHISCDGTGDGLLDVSVNSATDPSAYTMTWSGPGGYSVTGTVAAESTQDNLTLPGDYYVTVSYNGTCSVTEMYTIKEPAALTIATDLTNTNNISCNGGADGQISVTVGGGGGFGYTWYKWNLASALADKFEVIAGETNPIIKDRDAGRYKVVAELFSTSCEITHEVILTEPDVLTVDLVPDHITSCNGEDDGKLDITIGGGTAPYKYNYGTGDTPMPMSDTFVEVDDLLAGSYTVTVTDIKGCTVADTEVINEPDALIASITDSYISCEIPVAGPDGYVDLSIEGGHIIGGNQKYLITLQPTAGLEITRTVTNATGAAMVERISNLAEDTYTVTIKDANSSDPDNCLFTDNFTLETIKISGTPVDASCESVNDGEIQNIIISGASPTYTYSWSSTDGGVGHSDATLNQAGLSKGTYRLTVSDPGRGGCDVTKDFTIGTDREIEIDAKVTDVDCYGTSTGAIDITPNRAGFAYTWTGPGITPANQNLEDLVDIPAGRYQLVVDDGGCGFVAEYDVLQNAAVNFDVRYHITNCTPYERTIEIYNVSGGTGDVTTDYTFTASGPGSATQDVADKKRFLVTQGGEYTIEVFDKNLCSTVKTIVIPEEFTKNEVITHVKCNGGNTGSINLNLSGGSGVFTYAWTKTGDATFNETTPALSLIDAGEYNVVVTDVVETCTRSWSFDVNQPEAISLSIDKGDITCNGDNNGYINVQPSGGVAPYSYYWLPASGGIIQGDQNQSDLISGSYTVEVTDDNNCTVSQTVDINEDAPLTATLNLIDTDCDGTNGQLQLVVNGGSLNYTYNWSTTDGNHAALDNLLTTQTGLTGGTYEVTVTDADPAKSSCTFTVSETLTKAIEIINLDVQPVNCSGNDNGSISFDVIGGDGNYSYTWSTIVGDPSNIQTNVKNQSGLSEGRYQVVIRDGRISGGTDCGITEIFDVVSTTGLTVSESITNVDCKGASTGSISITISGGSGNYSIDWNNGTSTNVTSLSNVPAGPYQLKVTDNILLCEFIQSYNITEPTDALLIDLVDPTHVNCKDEATGAINIVTSGGTGVHKYLWSGGPSTPSGNNPTGLEAGTYVVTVEDDKKCQISSGNIVITEPAQSLSIDPNYTVNHVTAPGGTDGSITISVSGGTGSYHYSWTDDGGAVVGTDSPTLSGRGTGYYNVVVTDDNGCDDQILNIFVEEPGLSLDFNVATYDVRPCNGDANGIIDITSIFGGTKDMSTGTPTYNIKITQGATTYVDEDALMYTYTNVLPGTYKVIVTDALNVVVEKDVTVQEASTDLTIATRVINDASCYLGSDGTIEVTVNGGMPEDVSGNYLVEITGDNGHYEKKDDAQAGAAFEFTGLEKGEYIIRVTDHVSEIYSYPSGEVTTNCYAEATNQIDQPEAQLQLSVKAGDEQVCAGEQAVLSLATSNWNPTTNNLIVTIYDGDNYTDHTVNTSPFEITLTPDKSRFYSIFKIAKPGNTACLQGFDITPAPVEIKVNELPTATINSGVTEVCQGDAIPLSVAFSSGTSWTFSWLDNNNGTSGTVTTSDNPYIINDTPLADAQYTITSVDNGTCSNNTVSGTVDITVHANPTVVINGSTAICADDAAGATLEFDMTGTAPYAVTLEANAVEQTIVLPSDSEDWTVYPTETTTYEVKSIKDANNCDILVSGQSAIVTVNQLPEDIPSIKVNDPQYVDGVCQGAIGIEYSVDAVNYATGGYTWTAPANSTIVTGNGTTNVTLEFDTNFGGGYLQVKAINACADGNVTELWIPAKPLPSIPGAIIGPDELCQGETGFSYSIVPVKDATEYRWELPVGFSITGADDGAAIIVALDPMVDNIAGDIKVTPVNNCGDALGSATLPVQVYPLPVAYAGPDGNVCGSSDTYTMQADNPILISADFEGKWEVISGTATITNDSQYNTTVTDLSRGDVVFRWTVTNTASGTSLCSVYSDVTIRNNELSVYASVDASKVCDSEVELRGMPIPVDGSGNPLANTVGQWKVELPVGSSAVINNSASNITTASNLENGRNVFSWTITQNGCESKVEVEVFNDEPSDPVIINGAVVDVCSDAVTLNANDPAFGDGLWSLVSGSGVIATPDNDISTDITDLSKGANVFKYTVDNNGCIKETTITVNNNKLDVTAGTDETICSDTYTLSATPSDEANGIVGMWSSATSLGFDDATSATATVTGLYPDANVLTWTLTQKGCSSSATITLTNNLPQAAVVGTEQRVCAYETTLVANAPDAARGEDGYWSIVSGSGSFDDITDPNTKVTGLGHGENVFRWTLTHETCNTFADLKVTNLHVDVYAGKDTAICGREVTLNASPVPADAVQGYWSLSGIGSGNYKPEDRDDPKILMGGLDYGPNEFIWTIESQDGCLTSDKVVVTNNNPYYIDKDGYKKEVSAGGPTLTILSGSEIDMQANSPAVGNGVWSILTGGGTFDDVTLAGAKVTNVPQGESMYRWTVTNMGCTYWSDVVVQNGDVEQAVAGRNDSVCNDHAQLWANEPLVALGEWSVIEGAGTFDDKNKFNTIVRGLDAGENTFRWTLYNGASKSEDEVTITNNMVPVANAGDDGSVCNQTNFTLSGTMPTAGREAVTWSVISGSGTFVDDHAFTTVINGLDQGENVIKYEIEYRGCKTEDYVTITNNTPTTPIAGNDVTICTDSVQLTPNTPTFGTGEWIVTSGNADAFALESNWAKKLAPGTNELVWRITNNGCHLDDIIIITNNQPAIAEAGQDRPVCEDRVFLSGNVPTSGMGVGHWELIAGSGTIVTPTDRQTEVTGLGLGTNRFRWVIDNNGCIDADEVNISYNHIEANAGFDQVLCADSTVLDANAAHPGVGTWGVQAGSGSAMFEDPNSPYTKVKGLDPGVNVLTWTIDYGSCQDVSTVQIVNDSPTKANAGDDQALCDINSTTLNANIPDAGRGTGEWTIRNGAGSFSNSGVNNSVLSNIAFGDNIFRWTIRHNGCTSVDDVVVSYNRVEASVESDKEICSDETLLVANAATPGVGTWSVVGGTSQAVFENQNDPNTKVSKLAKGANTLRWTIDYRGCKTEADLIVTNNSPSTAYAGNLQELCQDNTVLDATAPIIGAGEWTILSGSAVITDPTNPKSAVSDMSKGDNVFRWTITNGICESVDEIRVVNNEPSVPYAGKDEESCENFIKLKAEAPLFGNAQWSIEEGGGNFDDPTSPTATISNLKPGTNKLIWTISQGDCELSDEIYVTNNAAAVANAGPDIQDCKDWYQLDANLPEAGLGAGAWTLVSGSGDFDQVDDPKTTIRNLGFGENILMWTITKGSCFTTDQVTVFNKIPDQSAAGDDQTTCESYATLNANNPIDGVGVWTVESGKGTFEDATRYDTKVNDLGYGENVFKWTIAYGDCTTDDIMVVTSNKAAPFAGDDEIIYENSYQLQAENPGSNLVGIWTVVSGEATIADANLFNTMVYDLNEGITTFRWTINTDGCSAQDEVKIEYRKVPTAGFEVDTNIGCYPLEVNFTNSSVDGSNYNWDFGNGNSSSVRNPSHTFTEPGVYSVVLTVAGPDGNDAVFSQTITVHDHPVADFNVGPETVYLPQDEIVCYDMSVDATSWYWEFGDGQISEEQNPRYTYQKEGTYSVTLTVQNQFGCENQFRRDDAITAIMSGYIKFPTAFSPRLSGSGSIGERDDAFFKPKHKDVESFHIQVFNRWGQLIYESHDIEEGWDGNYKGKVAPQAVYVFKASGRFTNGREFNEAGSVLLVR